MDEFRLHFGITNSRINVRLNVWCGWGKRKLERKCPGFCLGIKLREENQQLHFVDWVCLKWVFDWRVLIGVCLRWVLETKRKYYINRKKYNNLKFLWDVSYFFMRLGFNTYMRISASFHQTWKVKGNLSYLQIFWKFK